jgi:hypothetical protein
MKPDEQAEVTKLYVDAYTIHYTNNDMRKAFGLYRRILARYPYRKEAGYAASQIQTIINTVVPEEERLTVQMDMVAARFSVMKILSEKSDPVAPSEEKKTN